MDLSEIIPQVSIQQREGYNWLWGGGYGSTRLVIRGKNEGRTRVSWLVAN